MLCGMLSSLSSLLFYLCVWMLNSIVCDVLVMLVMCSLCFVKFYMS